MKLVIKFTVIVCIILPGCGLTFLAKGKVVHIKNGSSQSTIISTIKGQAVTNFGEPIKGAKITIFHEIDNSGKIVNSSPYRKTVLTDEEGNFVLSDYVPLRRQDEFGVRVEKDGYTTGYSAIVRDSKENELLIIMAIESRE